MKINKTEILKLQMMPQHKDRIRKAVAERQMTLSQFMQHLMLRATSEKTA